MTPPLTIDALTPAAVPAWHPGMGRMSHYTGDREERCQLMTRLRRCRDPQRRPKPQGWYGWRRQDS